MFQFPQLFPNFQPRPVEAINVDGEGTGDQKPGEDVKPDVKPTAAQLREKRAKEKMARPPEEGRIGTLVVMKSGRVKMVLGEDIVMNVSPKTTTGGTSLNSGLTRCAHLVHPADRTPRPRTETYERARRSTPIIRCHSRYRQTLRRAVYSWRTNTRG